MDGKSWNTYIDPDSEDEELHRGKDINLNKGEAVYFKATLGKVDENPNLNGFCRDEGMIYHSFVMKGSIKADGNIQFLLENTGTEMKVPDYCYYGMFDNCKSLIKAPALPATTMDYYCYDNMFCDCTALTQAPELPAMTLSDYCYTYMFYGCKSLTKAPILPAETLVYNCYTEMFLGCTSLPEPKYNMSHMTFDRVANAIQSDCIFGDWYQGDPIQIKCSDKILVATFDETEWQWTITES